VVNSPLEAAGPALPPAPAARQGRRAGLLERWLPAVPLLVLVSVMLIAPAIYLIVNSFLDDAGPTLDNWGKVLTSKGDQTAIITSLTLGVVVASLCTIVGAPVAWLISRMLTSRRAFWLALLNVAANFGGIGLAFAYFSTLGTVGMVTLALQGLGADFDPPKGASFTGLVIGYLYTNVPLFVLLTIPAMGALRDDWWEAAQVSSASRWKFWRRIGFPVLTPFIAAGWLLMFTWTIGIYGIVYALAGQGGATTLQLITLRIGSILESDVFATWRANVLAVILMLIATVSLLAYRRLLRRALRWF
jgi:putative spermidine/putrescine transport system permease protein